MAGSIEEYVRENILNRQYPYNKLHGMLFGMKMYNQLLSVMGYYDVQIYIEALVDG